MNPLFHIETAKERMAMFRGEHSKAVQWQPWSSAGVFSISRRSQRLSKDKRSDYVQLVAKLYAGQAISYEGRKTQ